MAINYGPAPMDAPSQRTPMVSSPAATRMPSRSDRLDDEDASSVSDYDSEWTQVSGTEDEAEGESDFTPVAMHGDRPLSRAGSSVDGDVWEGFTDDAHDDQVHPGDETVEPTIVLEDDDDERLQPDTDAVAATEEDVQVHKALNSSLSGTLRSVRSKSNAGSLQSSMTESQSKLRLSFPDPLARAAETSQLPSPVASVDEDHGVESCSSDGDSSSFADIGAPSTLSVSENFDEVKPEDPASRLFTIVLYGSRAPSRWRVAELVMKAIVQREPRNFKEIQYQRDYIYDELDNFVPNDRTQIRVIDRTLLGGKEINYNEVSGLSLAIIILPASIEVALPPHTLYLPLLNREPLSFESGLAPRYIAEDSAMYDLKSLELPYDKLVIVSPTAGGSLLDIGDLGSIDAHMAAKAFSLLSPSKKSHKSFEVVTLFANGWHLVAFVVFILLAAGIGIQTLVDKSSLARGLSKGFHTWNISVAETHATTLEATSFSGSAKENAVAVHQTSSLALSNVASSSKTPFKTPAAEVAPPQAINSPGAVKPLEGREAPDCACHTKQSSSWTAGLKETKDLLVRAIPAVPMKVPTSLVPMVIPKSSKDVMLRDSKAKGKEKQETAVDGSGTGVEGSTSTSGTGGSSVSTQVQEFLDMAMNVGRALVEVVSNDLRTLFDACDELLMAVARQVDLIRSTAKKTQTAVKEELVSRNKRASQNAKLLKEKGKQWLKREVLEPAKSIVANTIESAKQVHGDAVKSREGRRKVKESKKKERASKKNNKEKKRRQKGKGRGKETVRG